MPEIIKIKHKIKVNHQLTRQAVNTYLIYLHLKAQTKNYIMWHNFMTSSKVPILLSEDIQH